jgi:hypothetical protein
MGILLRHPAAAPTPVLMINAQALFGHHHPARVDQVELFPLVVDGVDYIAERCLSLLIRRDRLVNLTDDWSWFGYKATSELRTLTAALRDDLAGTAPVLRFDAQMVCALASVGAGVAPLAGDHPRDPHAVVYAGHRIGLAFPLPPKHSASVFGVVPGMVAPWPAEAVTR